MILPSACRHWQADQLGRAGKFPVTRHASYTTRLDTIEIGHAVAHDNDS
jgi:hypothetical protein